MTRYTVSDTDAWSWFKATHEDVEEILDLVAANYQHEILGFM